MGYRTDFVGGFKFDEPLTEQQRAYLLKFNETRRMKRDPFVCAQLSDPVREAVGLGVGEDGGYFVGGLGFAGQDHDPSVVNHNKEPEGQPGLWCQWVPDKTGGYLGWDGGEKFYAYADWLRYLIKHFFRPWGHKITGVVRWRGEDAKDRGSIVVTDNKIAVKKGKKIRITHGTKFKNKTCIGVGNKPARA